MDTHTSSVYKRLTAKIFIPNQLVLHFQRSQLSEYRLLKSKPSIHGTSTVYSKYNIALLSHVLHPKIGASQPTIIDQLHMRTIIKISHGRIFLRRVKIRRQD